MSTHNIGFYDDLTEIIFQLSSNTHLISLVGILIDCHGALRLGFYPHNVIRKHVF